MTEAATVGDTSVVTVAVPVQSDEWRMLVSIASGGGDLPRAVATSIESPLSTALSAVCTCVMQDDCRWGVQQRSFGKGKRNNLRRV
jgi:hypothetical protein